MPKRFSIGAELDHTQRSASDFAEMAIGADGTIRDPFASNYVRHESNAVQDATNDLARDGYGRAIEVKHQNPHSSGLVRYFANEVALHAPSIRSIFKGIASWPSLTRALHDRAYRIFDADGAATLLWECGQLRSDGLLTFDWASKWFRESVQMILAQAPGMWFVDESGIKWAVLVDPPNPETWSLPAWAVSWGDQSELLDPSVRRKLIPKSPNKRKPISASQFQESVDPVQLTLDARKIRRVEHLDQALSLATILVSNADGNGVCVLKQAEIRQLTGMGSICIQDLMEPLAELIRLEICRIDLGDSNGLQPEYDGLRPSETTLTSRPSVANWESNAT